MLELGMQIAQQYLNPEDKLIGVIGEAGAGKSMLIKGMFPGLDLCNDDSGVNVRPLPILSVDEDEGFYAPHTYHMDVRFESAFTQMHVLAEAVEKAVKKRRRVIVEHFELLYPFLKSNAQLLIGVGEEIIITRPTIFGPIPEGSGKTPFTSLFAIEKWHIRQKIWWSTVCRGNSLNSVTRRYQERVFSRVQGETGHRHQSTAGKRKKIHCAGSACGLLREDHVQIGELIHPCTGPLEIHVRSTGEIEISAC